MGLFDNYVNVECCECRITFGVPGTQNAERRQDGKMFWCPNGHAQCYRPSENDNLRGQVAALEKRLTTMTTDRDYWIGRSDKAGEAIAARDRRINSLRGVITRMKNKANN